MEKIFYTDISAHPNSTTAVLHILRQHFHITDGKIAKTENGKPYLENSNYPLFFSLSHTKSKLFIAFCDENVGVDAEEQSREISLPLLLKRFPSAEQREIASSRNFLRHWTAKESAVKWLGSTLAQDLKKLSFLNNRLYYGELELPVRITTLSIEGHILSVCSEKDFTSADILSV